MLFKDLSEDRIELQPKSKIELDADQGILLVPTDNSKIFIHWTNDKNKVVATHTMKSAILVTQKLQLSNPNDHTVTMVKLAIPNQNG
jgi:hypothetical protein